MSVTDHWQFIGMLTTSWSFLLPSCSTLCVSTPACYLVAWMPVSPRRIWEFKLLHRRVCRSYHMPPCICQNPHKWGRVKEIEKMWFHLRGHPLWHLTDVPWNGIVVRGRPVFWPVYTIVNYLRKTLVHHLNNFHCSYLAFSWMSFVLSIRWTPFEYRNRRGREFCIYFRQCGEATGEHRFTCPILRCSFFFTSCVFLNRRLTCLSLALEPSLDFFKDKSVYVLGSTIYPYSTELLLLPLKLVIFVRHFDNIRCVPTSSAKFFTSISD